MGLEPLKAVYLIQITQNFMMKKVLIFLVFSTITISMFAQSREAGQSGQVIPKQYIIKLREGLNEKNIIRDINQIKPLHIEECSVLSETAGLYFIKTQEETEVSYLTSLLKNINGFESVYQNRKVKQRRTLPNDPLVGQQWALDIIKAPEVWDVLKGGLSVNGDTLVVAVIDDGFDISHPDLLENRWVNHNEIPDNGKDDDGNGYIDDVYGFDFLSNTSSIPVHPHGTAASGIIGAKGDNNKGVTGINWNIKLMFLSGAGAIDDVIRAYEYVRKMRKNYNDSNGQKGAMIVATNSSFGIDYEFPQNFPGWCEMYDKMGEVGVLSCAATANNNVDVDDVGDMPSRCTSPYLIVVTNTSQSDEKYSAAAYGAVSVDLGAPGIKIRSTYPQNTYSDFDGCSAACPVVTGAAALLYSVPIEQFKEKYKTDPAQIALLVKKSILNGVDSKSSLSGKTTSGGRLNLYKALTEIQKETGRQFSIDIDPGMVTLTNNNNLTVKYSVSEFTGNQLLVINPLGQILYTNDLTPNPFDENSVLVPIDQLAAGIYFVALRNGKTVVTRKFFKI